MKPYVFAGGTAVVTGAGSGIGEAVAYGLAARGSHLVLVDRYAARLDRVAATLAGLHPEATVRTVAADLGDHEGTARLGERLARDHPETTLLVNNAGVALAGDFDEVSLAEVDALLEVDLHAAISLTHGLLPVLLTHKGSHVVVVSSILGIVAAPSQVPYVTAKFGVRGFAEALRHELAGTVGVTVVHPGGVATRIAEDARVAERMDRATFEAGRARLAGWLGIPAPRAAELILRAVGRRRPRLLIGWWSSRLPDLLVRVLPGSYGRVIGVFAGTRFDPRGPARSPAAHDRSG